ncbi:serine hydrolase-domain-containing protein [Podospora conica]|nr:serine hydrolase-domain-containing protein [Schizothecium conicum]
MRILCLHGVGSNPDLLRSQLGPLLPLLSSPANLAFLPAPFTLSTPPPHLTTLHPGPYLAWYPSPALHLVRSAHAYVVSFIRRTGPYDVLLGFSQGASLAASLLLHHELEAKNPRDKDTGRLVKGAIFLGGVLPFAGCTGWGVDVRGYFGVPVGRGVGGEGKEEGRERGMAAVVREGLVPAGEGMDWFLRPDVEAIEVGGGGGGHGGHGDHQKENQGKGVVDGGGGSSWGGGKKRKGCVGHKECAAAWEESGELYYQMFHASVDKVRIGIPTAHAYGRKDPWREHSRDLVELCGGRTWTYEHDGGHEIPKDEREEICDVIESLLCAIRK